ncbi:MAG: YihY family inner membrane protein [Rhodospirillaceae bacterium]|nr:YihY family inner membrane protein [Rhodospirillaceae bacterium]MBT5309198.1 YihY family inner membrane protein [Rhodospirillaceae bacterium]MBT6407451.1 YihY family inner membrane protein [Rhodospirillaceae bacterium]MBT7356039.1 YihY family inner membrane protein [Rhodospirillaceae bacterium]
MRHRLSELKSFTLYALKRYGEDQCQTVAAALSYTSLLAMVPLLAIVFAVLAQVPALESFRIELMNFAFANLLPDSGDKVAASFEAFIANAGKMTGFGIVGLVIAAMMLINTIFKNINLIFRVDRPRPIMLRLIVYVGVLVGGPLVLAVSFSMATYIFALTKGLELEVFTGVMGRLTRLMPAFILIVGFAGFYKVVPNRHVRWRDAFLGGLLAGVMFSGLRWLFGIYLVYFPTYKALYGALSAVPVFMLWMFLSWAVVLFGAVVAASFPDWREHDSDP